MANDLTQTIQRSLDEQVISNLGRLQEQGLEMPPGYSPYRRKFVADGCKQSRNENLHF